LYTNRAQVYIKIKKYQEAINDCDWSVRVSYFYSKWLCYFIFVCLLLFLTKQCKETWIKGYIHKGRALTYLKKFDEALTQFNKAKELEPTNKAVIDRYIEEMELCKFTAKQEDEANEIIELNKTDNMVELIEKLKNEPENDDKLKYYLITIKCIISKCKEQLTNKTIFRMKNGYEIIEQNSYLSNYIGSVNLNQIKNENELRLIESLFDLFDLLAIDCGKFS
jgi:tetratricopeptide (TPR) repeat protein